MRRWVPPRASTTASTTTSFGCGDYCPSATKPVVFGGSIDATFTGSWYDPAQSGQGLFLEVLPDHRMMAFWFTFNPAGTQQAWLVGTGTYIGNVATIDSIALPSGGRWIPSFDAAKIVDNAWGSMTLTFDGYDRGKVEFKSVLGYGTGSMNLTRLTRPAGIAASAASAPGQWVPTGGFNAPHGYSLALVTLANGKVLVVGGHELPRTLPYIDRSSNTVELYDPSPGTWSIDSPMNGARAGHTATLLPDGRVLVVGGYRDMDTALDTAELYDPGTKTWTEMFGPELVGHTATLLKTGKVLVVGGWDGTAGKETSSAWLYEPATHSWTGTGKMTFARQGHTTALLADGRAIVIGGYEHSSPGELRFSDWHAKSTIRSPAHGAGPATSISLAGTGDGAARRKGIGRGRLVFWRRACND